MKAQQPAKKKAQQVKNDFYDYEDYAKKSKTKKPKRIRKDLYFDDYENYDYES